VSAARVKDQPNTSVQFIGGWEFNHHWLRTIPLLVTVKFGMRVGFDPSEKSKIQICR